MFAPGLPVWSRRAGWAVSLCWAVALLWFGLEVWSWPVLPGAGTGGWIADLRPLLAVGAIAAGQFVAMCLVVDPLVRGADPGLTLLCESTAAVLFGLALVSAVLLAAGLL
ncbi:MAG: hypothetical protein AAF612_00305 [Planctomycetota bacterium]